MAPTPSGKAGTRIAAMRGTTWFQESATDVDGNGQDTKKSL